jgi:hypothetical protein
MQHCWLWPFWPRVAAATARKNCPGRADQFKEEVVLQKQWSRSIGDGQGETYNMLVPAIENDPSTPPT